MIPSALFRTSTPTNFDLSHFCSFKLALALGTCLASAINSAIVCSAAAAIFPVGEFTTIIPLSVAAVTSILSTPTPALAITVNLPAALIIFLVTWVSLLTNSASYSGIIAHISSSDSPRRETTSKCGVRMSRPSDEILSVARTFARGEEVPFETVMVVEEKEWCDGCWARMRKGVWADWFMGGPCF